MGLLVGSYCPLWDLVSLRDKVGTLMGGQRGLIWVYCKMVQMGPRG